MDKMDTIKKGSTLFQDQSGRQSGQYKKSLRTRCYLGKRKRRGIFADFCRSIKKAEGENHLINREKTVDPLARQADKMDSMKKGGRCCKAAGF